MEKSNSEADASNVATIPPPRFGEPPVYRQTPELGKYIPDEYEEGRKNATVQLSSTVAKNAPETITTIATLTPWGLPEGMLLRMGRIGRWLLRSGRAERLAEGSGKIWSSIRATQPVYEGTVIPRSFELGTANGHIWIHGNATEHLAEFATALLKRGVDPEIVNLGSQIQLQSLKNSVEMATTLKVPYGKIINAGAWELKFSAPRSAGKLPVLMHAMLK